MVTMELSRCTGRNRKDQCLIASCIQHQINELRSFAVSLQSGLQRQAERIADKTDQYRRQILQQTRFAIEQRTQISLAHANRVKQIALSLVTLIHTLQFHCPSVRP